MLIIKLSKFLQIDLLPQQGIESIDIELVATATIDRPVAFFIIDTTNNGTLGDITNLSNLTSSISYTPNNDFVGDDSFTYTSIDANGVVSNIGTIRIQ